MSLSKSQFKLINSLQVKKYRYKHGLFIAEGMKVVHELLNSSFELDQLFCVPDILGEFEAYHPEEISEGELKKISTLKSPNKVFGIFKIGLLTSQEGSGLKVVLDDVNDPGNLGTIIRLCDWFGVEELICSKYTVDCYNTKVVQSTMGSLSRVSIKYVDLEMYLQDLNAPIYIADMDGANIYNSDLPQNGVVVMGNEANGVSDSVKALVDKKLSIPRFGKIQETESLNVATATSIILSEFRRSIGKLK